MDSRPGSPTRPPASPRERLAVSELAPVLRAARERVGLSVRELAVRLGVSASTVSDAEGGRDVRHSTLVRYQHVLPGMTAHGLLGVDPPPPPRASPAAWEWIRDVFGFSVGRLRFEISISPDGVRTTLLEASGIHCIRGDVSDPDRRRALAHLVFRGSQVARLALAASGLDGGEARVELRDACFRHELRFPRHATRSGFSYSRRQAAGEPAPPDLPDPGRLALSAPYEEGASFPIELPIERLRLAVRFPAGALPGASRACAWTDARSLAADETDLVPFLHPGGLPVRREPRGSMLALDVERPVFGLQYGIGWSEDIAALPPVPAPDPARAKGPELGVVLSAARDRAGLSQRAVARALGISPVSVAGAERGQDVRRSVLQGWLRLLPELSPDDVLPPTSASGPMSRRDAWEHQRALLGVEGDEERKTLVITADGDAHAVCESLRLRRVRPSEADLRIRYGSAQATGRRLPTVLKAIEQAVAAEAEDAGLKARVVARRQGRLIHEIVVPRHLAQVGASYTRRLYDARFFDPEAEAEADDDEGEERPQDGAAIVPFHPVRRLTLTVRFPVGLWPERVWFAAHPRLLLASALPGASLAPWLHPEGLETSRSARDRTLTLSADYPLVGFLYDIFWERP